MALTQISTKGIKDGTITGTDLATNIDLVDNQKLRFGNSQDLQIYHSGSNAFILNAAGSGQLTIASNNALNLASRTGTEYFFRGYINGAAELYHDNNKKIETTSIGATVTGSLISDELKLGNTEVLRWGSSDTAFIQGQDGASGYLKFGVNNVQMTINRNGTINLPDNNKIAFGAGNDLQIYHDGSNSFIDETGTGSLILRASPSIEFRKAGGTEKMLYAEPDDRVELYYDNSKKFETTSSGVTVTGGLTTSGASTFNEDATFTGASANIVFDKSDNALEFADNAYLKLGTGDDLQIHHNGSTSFIENLTGDLNIRAKQGEESIKLIPNGAVELYYDNDLHFATTSDGCKTNGDLSLRGDGDVEHILFDSSAANNTSFLFKDNKRIGFGDSSDLQIYHDSNNSKITHDGAGGLYIGADTFALQKGDHSENYISMTANGAVDLYHDNQARLSTRGGGVDLRREAEVFVQMARTNNGQTDGDNVSTLIGLGKDDANNFTEYSKMITQIVDASNGTEDSRLMMLTMKNGTMTTAATIEAGYFQRNNAPGFAGEGFQWVNTNPNMHNGGIKFTSGDFNNSTGIFTCPVAGKYLCMATVQSHRAFESTGASTQYFNVLFQKNNSNYFGETVGTQHANGGSSSSVSANHFCVTQTVIVDCAVNDTIRAHSNHGYRNGVQNQLCIMLLA
tara:strand:- start:501 stop:2546 length:2046 start_codon:yes stop_codon:yes gene_type:complete